MRPARRVVDVRFDAEVDLSEVVAHLRSGGLVGYPTETVYGLGGSLAERSVEAVRELKGGREEKPLLALIPDREAASELEWTADAEELATIFWPGSLTLVLSDPRGIFPRGVRDERTGKVGVRMSPHPLAARLVSELGAPLTSTSLNRPGEPPAGSSDDALDVLERIGAEAEVWLLDGGTLPPSAPSTVVDCTGPEAVVIREGAVPIGRLRCAIPEIDGRVD